MSDFDAWIFFDGPVPESLRPVFDALRAPPPPSEEEETKLRRLLQRLDAKLSLRAGWRDEEDEEAPPMDVARRYRLDALAPESAEAAPLPAARPQAAAAPEPLAGPPACPPSPASLKETSQSPEFQAALRAGVEAAMQGRPPPVVRVAGAMEGPKTVQLPVMDVTAAAPPAARTAQAPAAAAAAEGPNPMAATLPLGVDMRALGLHAVPAPGAAERGAEHPGQSLRSYVGYRTELELWPASGDAIRRKYGVGSEAEHWEIVRVWEARFAGAPRLRAEADAIYASCLTAARRMGWPRSGGG